MAVHSDRGGRRRQLAALAMVGDLDRRESGTLSPPPIPLNLLILGDTSAGRDGCPDCLTYVDQLTAAMSQDGRRRVRIDDQTSAADRAPSSMPALLQRLRTDPINRSAVDMADVIVLAVGSGDVTPHQHQPAAARAAVSMPRGHRQPVPLQPDGMDGRDRPHPPATPAGPPRHHPTTNVGVTPPEPCRPHRLSNRCRPSRVCVNVYSLARTDQHVTTVKTDPLHPQLTQHGHDLVARQLIDTGLLR